jgi:hypothetical protein
MQVGGVTVKAKANCEDGTVRSVELSLPCGSNRFQESCKLTLAVPGEATVVRGRGKVPLGIIVRQGKASYNAVECDSVPTMDVEARQGQGSATVELKRRE